MDDSKLKAFNAISCFVQDLNENFGQKYKPVALYNRLIEKTTIRDHIAINKHIEAFKNFFNDNPNYLEKRELNMDAVIKYSDRVYIKIASVLEKSEPEAHDIIYKHLATIYTILNIGTEKSLQLLNKLKDSETVPSLEDLELQVPKTNEGNFVKNTLTEMQEHLKTTNGNPAEMITSMMQSGFFQKFMGDMQSGINNGNINLPNLMSTVQQVITQNIPQGEEGDQIKQLMSGLQSTIPKN
jgi:hypothetical protein